MPQNRVEFKWIQSRWIQVYFQKQIFDLGFEYEMECLQTVKCGTGTRNGLNKRHLNKEVLFCHTTVWVWNFFKKPQKVIGSLIYCVHTHTHTHTNEWRLCELCEELSGMWKWGDKLEIYYNRLIKELRNLPVNYRCGSEEEKCDSGTIKLNEHIFSMVVPNKG